MRRSSLAMPFLALAALAGCATANIKPNDLKALGSAPTAEEVAKVAHGSPLYRLDYLAGGHTYIYETYGSSDADRYYGLLFEDGKMVAVDLIGSVQAHRSSLRACTLFPPKADLDVERCFQDFNKLALADAAKMVSDDRADQIPSGPTSGEAAGNVVAGTAYMALEAPIMLPLVAVAIPLMGAAEVGNEYRRYTLDVKLGDPYAGISARVEQYPERYHAVTDGKGTVLIPGAIVPNAAAAFGVDQGKVDWIDLTPATACDGGFLLWGMTCYMGVTPAQAEPVPHRPRPVVMDDWENLAVYHTPPPQFEVLGETSGEAKGGVTKKGRMENAYEDMKKAAMEDGATGVLVYPLDYPAELGLPASPPPADGTPDYGPPTEGSYLMVTVHGLEIYVPADAAAFQKAAPLHASECDALSKKKDAAQAAYDKVKDTGTSDDVDSAKAQLESAEDAENAAFCGDDDWYAEQMAAQKH